MEVLWNTEKFHLILFICERIVSKRQGSFAFDLMFIRNRFFWHLDCEIRVIVSVFIEFCSALCTNIHYLILDSQQSLKVKRVWITSPWCQSSKPENQDSTLSIWHLILFSVCSLPKLLNSARDLGLTLKDLVLFELNT